MSIWMQRERGGLSRMGWFIAGAMLATVCFRFIPDTAMRWTHHLDYHEAYVSCFFRLPVFTVRDRRDGRTVDIDFLSARKIKVTEWLDNGFKHHYIELEPGSSEVDDLP